MWTWQIEGMTCGGCAARISRAVAQLDPQATVTADVPNKLVRVASRQATAEQVGQALAAAGYPGTLLRQEAPAPVAKQGGGCGCAARRAAAAGESQAPRRTAGACCG